MVSEGLIALITWNTKGSHCIFKFKYNSYKHFGRLGSLGWRLSRSDKLKYFLIFSSELFVWISCYIGNKKTPYPLQGPFLYWPQPKNFQERPCFCSLHKTFYKDTNTFGQTLPKTLSHWSKAVICSPTWNACLFSVSYSLLSTKFFSFSQHSHAFP